MFEEINEFYAFQEVEQLTENLRMWQQGGDFAGGDGGGASATWPSLDPPSPCPLLPPPFPLRVVV